MDNTKDTIFVGLALGAVIPVLGFIITEFIFGVLASYGLMDEGGVGIYSGRTRTIALIALCFNLLPFNFAKNRRWDNTMRGIVFPTLIYVGLWLWTYKGVLGLF